ncbi:putative dnaJ-like protein C11 [Plasmopara halstedii]
MAADNGESSPDFWRQDERDYYTLLTLPRDASNSDIRSRFLSLSREFHPDRRRQGNGEIVAAANAQYAILDRAYKVLLDPVKRHVYDMYGEKGLQAYEQDQSSHQYIVGTHFNTQEDLHEYIENLLRRMNEQTLAIKFPFHSEMSMTIDASDFLQTPMKGISNLFNHGKQYLDRPEMTFHQRTEFLLSRQTSLTIGGFLYDRNGLSIGSFTTGISYKSFTPSFPSFTLSTQLGWRPKVQCQMSQQISRYTVLMFIPEIDENGIDLSIGMNQLLSSQMHGTMMWSTRDGLSGSLNHDTNQQNATVALAVNSAGPNLTFQLRRIIAMTSTIKVSIRASLLTGVSFVTGISQEVSDRTRLAIGVLLARAGITLRLGFTRGNVRFVMPIFLSPFSIQSAYFTFCAATSPFLVAAVLSQIIKPAQERQRRFERQTREMMQLQYLATAFQSAQEQQKLMLRSAEEKMKLERERSDGKGLMILLGRYGKNPTNLNEDNVEENDENFRFEDESHETLIVQETTMKHSKQTCIDVTIPLQFFVKNGELCLPSASKAGLLGFYNPCLNEVDSQTANSSTNKPLLYIRYVYDGQVFEATFDDHQAVSLPSKYAQVMGPAGRVY